MLCRYFVVRLLLALHGKSYVKDLINTPLNFLLPDDVQDSLASFIVPDVYVAFQKPAYPELLSMVAKVVTHSSDKERKNIQDKYNSAVIFIVKRMLTSYHQKKSIRLNPHYERIIVEFDPQILTRVERGILTKILKQENKRLKKLNIIEKRKKKAYYRQIFMASY